MTGIADRTTDRAVTVSSTFDVDGVLSPPRGAAFEASGSKPAPAPLPGAGGVPPRG